MDDRLTSCERINWRRRTRTSGEAAGREASSSSTNINADSGESMNQNKMVVSETATS